MDTCPAQIIQRVLEYGQWGRLAINSFLLWIGQNRINMQVITHPLDPKSLSLHLLYLKHL